MKVQNFQNVHQSSTIFLPFHKLIRETQFENLPPEIEKEANWLTWTTQMAPAAAAIPHPAAAWISTDWIFGFASLSTLPVITASISLSPSVSNRSIPHNDNQ
ncbi:hypothetical protein Bca4012_081592 [Brassica carinata]